MKSYEEMVKNVFNRIDEYEEKKRRRLIIVRKISVAVPCVCMTIFLGFFSLKKADIIPEVTKSTGERELVEVVTPDPKPVTSECPVTTLATDTVRNYLNTSETARVSDSAAVSESSKNITSIDTVKEKDMVSEKTHVTKKEPSVSTAKNIVSEKESIISTAVTSESSAIHTDSSFADTNAPVSTKHESATNSLKHEEDCIKGTEGDTEINREESEGNTGSQTGDGYFDFQTGGGYPHTEAGGENTSVTTDQSPVSGTVERGDINCDGTVNLTDLSLLSLYLMKKNDLTYSQLLLADMDENNKIDIADLAYLLNIVITKQ